MVNTPSPANAAARFGLNGKVAWVVGGAGLLGTAVCHALAEHGAHVVVSDLRRERAEAVAEQIRRADLSADAMALDVADEAAIVRGADDVANRRKRLDVVVNMAWFYTKAPMEQMSASDWERGMRVTLTGAFVVSREAGRIMTRQGTGGSIVQFSSMYGVVSPDPQMYGPNHAVNPVDYGVAKAGVLQLVRYQAVMLAPQRIRVNAIVPGPFPDPNGQGADEAFLTRLNAKVPMGRVGKPPEIAGAVVYLASDASTYVTGTHLTVDGGWTAW